MSCCVVCNNLHGGAEVNSCCEVPHNERWFRFWRIITFSTGLTGKRHITQKCQSLFSSCASIFRIVCACTFFFRCVIFLTCFCAACMYCHLLFAFLVRPVRKSISRRAAVRHLLLFIWNVSVLTGWIFVKLYAGVKVKVKFTLEETTKVQRGSRGIALLFL